TSMIPLTESIASSSSEPQTGHMGQRRLHFVAKSMSARSGSSLTGRGIQPKLGSTQGAFDQSFVEKIARSPQGRCPAPEQDIDQVAIFHASARRHIFYTQKMRLLYTEDGAHSRLRPRLSVAQVCGLALAKS